MRIPPELKFTEKILNSISSIDEKIEILKNKKIPRKSLEKLKIESLLKSSLFSARIEGNKLSLKEANHLSTKKREHLEVRNIIRALKYINQNIKINQKITFKFIKRIHKISMDKLMDDAGFFRTKQNAIFTKEGFVVYMPPPPEEAMMILKRLIQYINSDKHVASPAVKATIIHFVFEKIHPFIDGNGRVGRLLIYTIFRILNYPILNIVSFEEQLNKEKEDYYYYLEDEKNVQGFIEFMLEIFDESINKVVLKIEGKSKFDDSDLLPRREEIWQIIKDHKSVSLDFIKRRFQEIPERSLRNDLEDLLKRKLIIKLGKTKGAMYKINDEKS